MKDFKIIIKQEDIKIRKRSAPVSQIHKSKKLYSRKEKHRSNFE